jgi:hypothetical protein
MKLPTFDRARATLAAKIAPKQEIKDYIKWQPKWGIHRYTSRADCKNQVVYEDDYAMEEFGGYTQHTYVDKNLLCHNGLENLFQLLATSGGTQYANANAYLGVGTSSTAANIADIALGAGAVYQAMDVSYPAITGTNHETCTWRGTYASGSANQAWNEFGIFTSNAGAKMLNHVISAQGTKVSGQTWQLDMAITLS